MFIFNWGVFWAVLAALAIKGIVGRFWFLQKEVEIHQTAAGFRMEL